MQVTTDNMGIDPQKYYTVSEAARLLGVHRCTIWRWVNTFQIKFRTRVVNNRKEFLGSELVKLFKHI